MYFSTIFIFLFVTLPSLSALVIRPANLIGSVGNNTKSLMAVKEIAIKTGDNGCDFCKFSMVIAGPEVRGNNLNFFQKGESKVPIFGQGGAIKQPPMDEMT